MSQTQGIAASMIATDEPKIFLRETDSTGGCGHDFITAGISGLSCPSCSTNSVTWVY